jgi:hypothetical protein
MKFHPIHTAENPRLRRSRALWAGILAGLAAIAIAPVVGGEMLQIAGPPQGPPGPHAITPTPDDNVKAEITEQDTKTPDLETANAERKKEIADDSAKLLKLATELKAEVDKTTKDTLSLNVIRKAGEIEKLAHTVKEKMKLPVGPG